MSPTAYSAQMTAIDRALRLARETNDLAAILSDFTTKVRLIRLQYAMRTATLAS
jgi:hypothetical protein